MQVRPDLWMPMIDTADIVAERYHVSREAQDEYALASQQRTARAQANGLFKDEIVPMPTKMKEGRRQGHLAPRASSTMWSTTTSAIVPDTTLEGLRSR